ACEDGNKRYRNRWFAGIGPRNSDRILLPARAHAFDNRRPAAVRWEWPRSVRSCADHLPVDQPWVISVQNFWERSIVRSSPLRTMDYGLRTRISAGLRDRLSSRPKRCRCDKLPGRGG